MKIDWLLRSFSRKFIWHVQDKGEIEKRERVNYLGSSSRIDLDYIESWLHQSYHVSTSWLGIVREYHVLLEGKEVYNDLSNISWLSYSNINTLIVRF